MSEPSRVLRAVVVTTMALCFGASLVGAKAGGPAGGDLKMAVVNPAELVSKYKYTVEQRHDLDAKAANLELSLRTWANNPFLSEADQKKMGDLIIKGDANLTGPEKDQVKKLTDASTALNNEFNTLQQQQVGQANQQGLARLKEFNTLGTSTTKRIDDYKTSLQTDIQAQAAKVRDKVDTDVHAAIAKVAKDKGFNLVFSSEVVLYADSDITQAILDKLNK